MAGGLRPYRHLGSKTFVTNRYRAAASGDIFTGDPVFVSAGLVKAVADASASLLGVAARAYNDAGRPLTHGTAFYKASGVSGFVDVYDDPDIVYVVSADATASAGFLPPGGHAEATAGTPTTAAGRSGFLITSAASAGQGQFRVARSAASDLDNDGVASEVEVVIARSFHAFGS